MSAPRILTGRVVIATHNAGKLVEMRELLMPFGVEAVSAGELCLPEPEETGTMFAENAAIKAIAAAQASGLPAFADDSGLCVNALDGAPGLFSARWAGSSKTSPVRWLASRPSSTSAEPRPAGLILSRPSSSLGPMATSKRSKAASSAIS